VQFENSFDVPVGAAEAWALLIDIRRIAPCMPGAELTEVVDPRTYKGKLAVKLGPVALSFAGTVQFESMDEAQHTARVKAQGSDQKGRGGAHAENRPGGPRGSGQSDARPGAGHVGHRQVHLGHGPGR